ncbi:TonB-dependent receptor [Aurantiacibacter xanthus]|uniref:TonB-dependent receptor n=1 Tax=Aurantiacibacter xanthus TaxID=1784712 RepID=A0A3A1P0A4_9SPHN|nr:TonB-dependent receptor [Aurantiacibacter xanthus]RIV81964.1 TonB-dependent receptor [Aurantiacibacter xanthus]
MGDSKYLWTTCAALAVLAIPAHAQDNSGSDREDAQQRSSAPGTIIVTANKREQAANDVGLTIQAASAETLADRGISGPDDLAKLVPGFTFTQSLYSTPVYTLRGIGLYDATFGAAPSVSIYSDEIPRNVPTMSDGLDLDIERLEVLKGPQGTLFGQSSTGGAINYVIGKPTSTFEAGASASYERFDRFELEGFVSGPLSDTLKGRLAVKGVTGGAWQRSLSRPNDENGTERKLAGRLTLDFEPTPAVRLRFMATGALDKSDPLAPQYAGTIFNIYGSQAELDASGNPYGYVDATRYQQLTDPTSPGYDASFLGRRAVFEGRLASSDPEVAAGANAALGTPISDNARDGEWTPGLLSKSDNNYYQLALRGDFDVSDTITLTSITALAEKNLDYNQDLDGTTARVVDVPLDGYVKTFNQELRIAGNSDQVNWIVGASYDNIETEQNNFFYLGAYSGNADLISITLNNFSSKQKSYSAFGNVEWEVMPDLRLQGGIRYTRNELNASYCYNDPAIDTGQGAATLFGSGLNSVPITINPGECFPTSGDILLGTAASTIDPVLTGFDEDNVSFRLGANYQFSGGTLIYATVSQGYKAGIYSAIGASRTNQYTPATQEKVVAYEAGFKAPLGQGRYQLNAAGFYYDYSDKQVRGRVQDTVFGLLEKLLNVPSSYIWGLEGEFTGEPVDGLNFSTSATYLQSKVTGNYSQTPDGLAVYNAAGFTGDFSGSKLPYTPEFSANADIQYRASLGGDIDGFIGGTVVYTGKQNATFETSVLQADDFVIDDYTTLDLRAGIASQNDRWRVSVFGRNVTDESYVTAVSTFLDTLIRYRGRPATYGISFDFKY